MTNNIAGRRNVRILLVGDNVFDQLSYARVKNCEVYPDCYDKIFQQKF